MKKSLLLSGLLTVFSYTSIFAQVIPVNVEKVHEKEFKELLDVQGSVEAVNIARVSSRIPGPIESIYVKEGDEVIAGETKLFVIDHLKLEKALEIRQQEVVIAKLALKEKESQLKQVLADLEKSRLDANRARILWEDNSTSQDNYEKANLKLKISEASYEHILTVIDLSREQLAKAEIALTIAEKDFSDSTIISPLTGVVSEKLQEPGEMAAAGKPIIIVKDPNDTEVSAYLPAEYYHKVSVEQTPVTIKSFNNDPVDARVTYKSPEISPDLRTFKIKCHSLTANNLMVPGGLANLTLVLQTRKGMAVPTSAIVNRNGGKAIFIVRDNKAKIVKVTPGLENDGYTEIVGDTIKSEDSVITKGQHMLNDDQDISVQGGNK